MTRVEWEHTVDTSRVLRVLALSGFAAIGAVFVAVAGLAVLVVVGSLLAGKVVVLALAAVLAALFARRVAAHVELARRGQTEFPLPPREIGAASAAWAGADALLLQAGVPFSAVAVPHLIAVFAALPLSAGLRSEGVVDTQAGVVRVRDRETDLHAVRAVSRYELGPVAVLRVRYHDGAASPSDPRYVGVPATDAARIRDALLSSDAPPPESTSQPLVAAVLAVFGLGLLAFAAGLLYLAATDHAADGRAVLAYAAVFAGVLAALFLTLAARQP